MLNCLFSGGVVTGDFRGRSGASLVDSPYWEVDIFEVRYMSATQLSALATVPAPGGAHTPVPGGKKQTTKTVAVLLVVTFLNGGFWGVFFWLIKWFPVWVIKRSRMEEAGGCKVSCFFVVGGGVIFFNSVWSMYGLFRWWRDTNID